MSETFDKFCSDVRTKINDADKRLKGLRASARSAGQKAKDDAKAHLSGISVMESAQDWATKNVSGAIDGARDGCIFLQG